MARIWIDRRSVKGEEKRPVEKSTEEMLTITTKAIEVKMQRKTQIEVMLWI